MVHRDGRWYRCGVLRQCPVGDAWFMRLCMRVPGFAEVVIGRRQGMSSSRQPSLSDPPGCLLESVSLSLPHRHHRTFAPTTTHHAPTLPRLSVCLSCISARVSSDRSGTIENAISRQTRLVKWFAWKGRGGAALRWNWNECAERRPLSDACRLPLTLVTCCVTVTQCHCSHGSSSRESRRCAEQEGWSDAFTTRQLRRLGHRCAC